MPPRASSSTPAPATLSSLISSTTYPIPPSLEQLDSVRREILFRRQAIHDRLVSLDPNEEERLKNEKRERKRKERERLAREAKEAEEAEQRKRLGSVKKERTLSPVPSAASVERVLGPKKRKNRVVVDSDDETQGARATASPPHHVTTSGLKVKLPHAKSRPSLTHIDIPPPTVPLPSSVGANIDFSLPGTSSRPLIPLRPGVAKPLPPGPKRQADVDEDFSNVKTVGAQVPMPTFWSSIDPYLKQIGEDDLAVLGFKADAPEVYDIPPRGRHYTEVWDEEDGIPIGSTPRMSVPNLRNLNGTYPSNIPPLHELRDENLVDDLRGLGNVTERLVAAMMGEEPDPAAVGRLAQEFEGGMLRVDVKEMEEKLKRELRAVMLLGEHDEFDPMKKDDDEITSALRQSQRLLAHQVALNDARKLRLVERAKHRLAYSEYQNALEGLEKSIETNWAKLVKKQGLKKGVTTRPPVPDQLKKLVAVRKSWLESVGARMKDRPVGEVAGLPENSVYEGIGNGEEQEEEDEMKVEGALGYDEDGEEVEA